jgi:hypothetical protein
MFKIVNKKKNLVAQDTRIEKKKCLLSATIPNLTFTFFTIQSVLKFKNISFNKKIHYIATETYFFIYLPTAFVL